MNEKCSDNKGETTCRRAKERKNTENYKRTGQLKNMVKQKDNRVN
jgi:hypothetical protein